MLYALHMADVLDEVDKIDVWLVLEPNMKWPGGATNTPGPVHLKAQADMVTLLGFFGVLARLLRPTRGAHTTAFGYLRELGFEARRNRSRRVRRYVKAPVPAAIIESEPIEPAPPAPLPPIPAPRRPVENAPWKAVPQVEIGRGPYRAWEAQRDALVGVAA